MSSCPWWTDDRSEYELQQEKQKIKRSAISVKSSNATQQSDNQTIIINKVLHTAHFIIINNIEDDFICDFYEVDFYKGIYEPNKVT